MSVEAGLEQPSCRVPDSITNTTSMACDRYDGVQIPHTSIQHAVTGLVEDVGVVHTC